MEYYQTSLMEELEQELSSTIYFNYHDIVKDDMSNGEGLRVVLFLAGCSHRCPYCQNPETWDASSGIPFTNWDLAELYEALGKDYIQGITFSGGDPLFKRNRDAVGQIITKIRKDFPDKDVWLYTGYSLEQHEDGSFFFIDKCPWLENHDSFEIDWLDKVDVVVDGPYMDNIRKEDLKKKSDPEWRGSSNQRVLDIKKSIKEGALYLWGEGGKNG